MKHFHLKIQFFHKIGRNAFLDWSLSLIIALILVIFFAIMAYLAYDGTSVIKTGMRSPQNQAQKPLFDNDLMDDVFKVYESRAILRESLEKNYSVVSDPSL